MMMKRIVFLLLVLLSFALPVAAQDVVRRGNVWSGVTFIISRPAIATTSTDGLLLTNPTASTAGVPVQQSPRLLFGGTAYNSVSTLSETSDWIIENLPITNAGTTTSALQFKHSTAGGAYSAARLSISSGGQIASSAGFTLAPTGFLSWSSARGLMSWPSDGVLLITDGGQTSFGRLQFGGTTSSFPSLKRNGTVIEARLADDSGASSLRASNLLATSVLYLQSRTTAAVDAATTFISGTSYRVLACTGPETINTITGGGTGALLYLEHSDSECTLVDADAAGGADSVNLTGTATNSVGAVDKVITLIYNGTYWLQTGGSVN